MGDKGDKRAGTAGAGRLGYSLTIVAYLGLNTSLNLSIKYALGHLGFQFPIALTCAHMAFSFLALLPVMLLPTFRGKHIETLSKSWKGLTLIGVFLAANIALNNLSLVSITLTLNQIIRSSIPVVTALMAVPVEGKIPTRVEFIALCTITCGVMLSVWQGVVAGSLQGITYCCVATLSNAAMMTFSGKILSDKLDVIRLTFYTAPISVVALLPLCWLLERTALVGYLDRRPQEALWIVLLTSANALAYNVIHYLTIQMTSAVTTTVLGMVKIIGLLLLSGFLLGEGRAFTTKLAVGCLLALTGFFLYSWAKLGHTQSSSGSPSSSPVRHGQAGPHYCSSSKGELKMPLIVRAHSNKRAEEEAFNGKA